MWLRHNLEGKYDNIPYNQSRFYWRKIKFQMPIIGLKAVISSQDKRSYNRLLSERRYTKLVWDLAVL